MLKLKNRFSWRSNYKLPASFILFFVLTFFLLGEQLSTLPTYLGSPQGSDNTVHILDKAWTDALHRPLFYFLFAAVVWLVFRFLHWLLAWTISLVALSLLIHMPPEDISKLGGIRADKLIVISVLTLAPYFTFRAIDKKWGLRGKQRAMLILVAINVLFLGFFAYQIYVRHNSHRNYSQQSGQNSDQTSSSKSARPSQPAYPNLSMATPYVNERDIISINEAYSLSDKSPWGFKHVGIDFMSATDLIPVQAVAEGTVEMLNTSKESEQQGWHTGLCINHNPFLVCYNFETFSPADSVSQKQRANVFVKNGDKVKQGDLIGKLVHGGSGAHIDFGVVPLGSTGDRVCPEPYFSEAAKASILRLIHKDHPTWNMCY